ncbi:MAG: glycerol-3-phosphate 1-O-acyltransferase PlsY [Clostridiales bacterium]|nr:glycerol-3-phosphate 1-O-acyltransferase PlsY [Clostridiales bacterium]
MSYVLGCIVCYLLGAVPFSVLFSRGMLHKDVRRYGSGNPGTSNMTRAFGIKYGLLVLLFDMAKGFGAVYLGQWIMGPLGAYLGALCAVAGHNWPIYLKFKGGKGVATTVGVMLAFVPYITLIAMACFLVVLAVSRYFSLGSLVCLGLVWVLVLCLHFADTYLVVLCSVLVLVAFVQHRANIRRLKNGTENRFGSK